jgi:hypothetical protein
LRSQNSPVRCDLFLTALGRTPRGLEVRLRDPSGHFLQEPVCILDPIQELLRLLNSLREFSGTVSIDR